MTIPKQDTVIVGLADITGFAKACRHKPDLEVFHTLNTFYNLVGQVLEPTDGRIIKFMGDAALVMFPQHQPRQAMAALQKMVDHAAAMLAEFDDQCTLRFKAHVGPVAMGPMGPDQRFDIIGGTLNELFLMPWDGPTLSTELEALLQSLPEN